MNTLLLQRRKNVYLWRESVVLVCPLSESLQHNYNDIISAHFVPLSSPFPQLLDNPRISLYPPGQHNSDVYVVEEGRRFELECSSDHFNVSAIRVERNNSIIVQSSTNRVSTVEMDLFGRVTGDDAGVYQCVVEAGEGLMLTRNFTVIIHSMPFSTLYC